VLECTGGLTRREDLEQHVRAGARTILLSAPSKGGEVETVVHGANVAGGDSTVISCASCTPNCITPIVEVIGRRIGFAKATMTTVHAYAASQSVGDGPSKQFRRGWAAAAHLVPASTGAARATTERCRRMRAGSTGSPVRAPTPNEWSYASQMLREAVSVSRRVGAPITSGEEIG
jgi:glyceraldehyde 3-phosphate dehydrogenase